MFNVTLPALIEQLSRKDYRVEEQKETDQIFLHLKIHGKQSYLFIKIFNNGQLIQFLTFLPLMLKAETAGETARLLLFFNREIDLPGFGMDEINKALFYRLVYPITNGEMDEAILHNLVRASEVACETATPSVAAVNQGTMTFEMFLQKAREAQREDKNSKKS